MELYEDKPAPKAKATRRKVAPKPEGLKAADFAALDELPRNALPAEIVHHVNRLVRILKGGE